MEEKNNAVIEEGALKVTKLTMYEAMAIIVGANIGSGILGLAYSTRLAGWPILLLWLIVAGVFTTFSMLYVAESALRTKKPLQLPGLAEKYVGKAGSVLVFISVCANSIGCMIAYTSGSGNILCTLLGLPNWAGSLLFTVPCVLVVWFGLKATGLWEKFMSTGMVVLLAVIIIASFLSGKADVSRAMYANWKYAVPLLSSAIFCYIAQYAVPELARGMVQDGADIIFVPAFWPAGAPLPPRTDHWDTLVNCTALLNQTYVVAVNQYGHMSTEIPFGRSCTVDPWGTVIAQCANRVCISYAELDMGYQQQVRERLATWPNRRPDCYTLH